MGDDPIINDDQADLLHKLVEPLHFVMPAGDQNTANAAHALIDRLRSRFTGGLPWWLLLYLAHEVYTDKGRR